jgi:hypothetical protein
MSATPSAEALYSERIVWAPSYPLAAVLAIVGVTQLFNQWIVGAILLGAAALVMWFCVARYTVTRQGVDVHVGLGRPHLHIAATDIASVDPTRVSMLLDGLPRKLDRAAQCRILPRRQRSRSDHDTPRQTTSTGEPASQRPLERGSIPDRLAPTSHPKSTPFRSGTCGTAMGPHPVRRRRHSTDLLRAEVCARRNAAGSGGSCLAVLPWTSDRSRPLSNNAEPQRLSRHRCVTAQVDVTRLRFRARD